MKNKKDKQIRVDENFKKALETIKVERIKRGLDREMKSDRRITLGMTRLPSFSKIVDDLINANFSDDKRGAVMDLFILMIIGFVAILFLVIGSYAWHQITITLEGQNLIAGQSNITQVTQQTFGQIDNALPQLQWISIFLIFGLVFGILISNFLVKAHPVFFVAYIFVVLLSIIFAAYLSNAYETVIQTPVLTSTFQGYTASNYFFLNLPLFITIIGFIGGILLFMGMLRDTGQGGTLQ